MGGSGCGPIEAAVGAGHVGRRRRRGAEARRSRWSGLRHEARLSDVDERETKSNLPWMDGRWWKYGGSGGSGEMVWSAGDHGVMGRVSATAGGSMGL